MYTLSRPQKDTTEKIKAKKEKSIKCFWRVATSKSPKEPKSTRRSLDLRAQSLALSSSRAPLLGTRVSNFVINKKLDNKALFLDSISRFPNLRIPFPRLRGGFLISRVMMENRTEVDDHAASSSSRGEDASISGKSLHSTSCLVLFDEVLLLRYL